MPFGTSESKGHLVRDPIGQVDSQHGEGDSANCRASLQSRTVPTKVVVPVILPRVEQPLDRLGCRVPARDVGAFESIAVHASVRQIFQRRFRFVLFRDDVIQL